MQTVPKEWLDFLREQFPKNSRIQLTEMGDDSQSLPTIIPASGESNF